MKDKISSLVLAALLCAAPAGAAEFGWRLGSHGGWWDLKADEGEDLLSNTAGYSLGVEGRTDIGDSKLLLAGINFQKIFTRQADTEESYRALGGFANGALGFYLRKGEKVKIWAGPEIVFTYLDGKMTETDDSLTLRGFGAGGAAGMFLAPFVNWTLGGRIGVNYSVIDGDAGEGSISGGGLGSYLLMGFDF